MYQVESTPPPPVSTSATTTDFRSTLEDYRLRVMSVKDEHLGFLSDEFDMLACNTGESVDLDQVTDERQKWLNEEIDAVYHMRVLSVNSLSHLLSYSDLEGGGDWEAALEEDLDLNMEQLLTVPDSQYSYIVGEEGRGKTALLRHVWRHYHSIAPKCMSTTFSLYIHCAHLVSCVFEAKAREGGQTSAVEILLQSAMRSWALSTSYTTREEKVETHLRTLLEKTKFPVLLCLDGLDLVPLDLANELMSNLLSPRENETEENAYGTIRQFCKEFHILMSKRTQRIIVASRLETLSGLLSYRPSSSGGVGDGDGSGENEAEGGEGAQCAKQWRICKFESLVGEAEECLFLKILLQRYQIMNSSIPISSLLDMLTEKIGTVIPFKKRTPLMLFLVLRDCVPFWKQIHFSESGQTKDQQSGTVRGTRAAASNLYDLFGNILDDLLDNAMKTSSPVIGNLAKTAEEREKEERRRLLGLLAFLVAWWDDSFSSHYQYPQHAFFRTETSTHESKSFRSCFSQKSFLCKVLENYCILKLDEKYHTFQMSCKNITRGRIDTEASTSVGQNLFDEILEMFPGTVFCHKGLGEKVFFTNSFLQQFLVADFLLFIFEEGKKRLYEGLNNSLEEYAEQNKVYSSRHHQSMILNAEEASTENEINRKTENIDVHKEDSVAKGKINVFERRESNKNKEKEGSELMRIWKDEHYLTHKWWAEVYTFIGFQKGVQWLGQQLLCDRFSSLGDWFSTFAGHNTDPSDIGQIRFTHLLRAKACEAFSRQTGKNAKGYSIKKKTKWGNAFLKFFDISDTTLIHLECYPVYLHLPHCLGTKAVESVMVKCIDLLQGINSTFITDLLLQFYIGGCLSDRDIQKIVDNFLEDEEARMRKTAIRFVWRLTLLCRTNRAIFLPFARTRADKEPEKEKATERGKDKKRS